MLCVIGLIMILVALTAAPLSRAYWRAREMDWDFKAGGLAGEVADQLRRAYAGQSGYPAASLAELEERRLLEPPTVSLIRNNPKRVRYFPFSSETSPDAVILTVRYSDGSVDELTKKTATELPAE